MAVKLLALDLDDTLLDGSSRISPQCRTAVQQAVAQGVVVTIATGRMYEAAVPFARQLGLDIPIITYNGALIKGGLSGEVIYSSSFEPATAAEILTLFDKRGWYIQVYRDDQLYVEERNDKARKYEEWTQVTAVPVGRQLYTFTHGVYKMLAVDEEAAIGQIRAVIADIFGERVFAPLARPNYLELLPPHINKGWAIGFLADKMGIAQSEIMAIGDSYNDIDMIRYAGLGVAMGNAMPAVKQAADAITLANDEDGVAEAIRKYILA